MVELQNVRIIGVFHECVLFTIQWRASRFAILILENFGKTSDGTFRYITFQCDGILKVSVFASLARCSQSIYQVLGGTQAVLKKYQPLSIAVKSDETEADDTPTELKEVS